MGFADVFLILAVLFVAVGALAVVMRRPAPQTASAAAAHQAVYPLVTSSSQRHSNGTSS